ncbi:MAG: hypothetical protein D3925_01255 [Candidatus Electrothrix sp. AR5]|nr:hypothetical protein [Candidatus Electrothrix sp. AR5]
MGIRNGRRNRDNDRNEGRSPSSSSGVNAVGVKFYKPACVPFLDTATRYDYHAKNLGEDAAVTLFVTEKEKTHEDRTFME